jgi:hypothetical protein
LGRASPSHREVATGLPGWQIKLPDSENCHMFGESLSLTEGGGNRAARLADKEIPVRWLWNNPAHRKINYGCGPGPV